MTMLAQFIIVSQYVLNSPCLVLSFALEILKGHVMQYDHKWMNYIEIWVALEYIIITSLCTSLKYHYSITSSTGITGITGITLVSQGIIGYHW